MNPVVVDFETKGIVGNPLINPPKPVGVSIKWPGYAPNYFAWGHPRDNNCSIDVAMTALGQVITSGLPICFHHAGFDIRVWASMSPAFAQFWRTAVREKWHLIHDTVYLVFLADPYAPTFSLKPSAERHLNLPPDEQTNLKQWVLQNVPQATAKDWGAFISEAPGSMVAPYANGDTIRTEGLHKLLYARIIEQGMEQAYDRERRLFPITMEATIRGIRIDRERLGKDTQNYTAALDQCEERLCIQTGITRAQLEDDEEALKDGLTRCGAVKEWVLTPKSKVRSMSQDNLKIEIPAIRDLLDYRGALKTCLQTFMRPWLVLSASDNRIHPNWNQVRQAKGDYNSKGARTGRLSSDDPSVMNIPTDWEYKDGTPMAVPPGLPPYPVVRSYVLPEVNHVWLKRDFSSQEFRIVAHYEDGTLKEAYIQNPLLDPHDMAQKMIQALVGLIIARLGAKIIGFSIVYGSGAPGLSHNLKVDIPQARMFKAAYLEAMPGVKDLMDDVQLRGKLGIGIRTWGGRVYLSEPSKMIDGRVRDFHYKLLNYLIQGSAADQTKDCIVDWDSDRGDGIFLATVHDEINISAPKETANVHMSYLKRVMERDRFSVPFRSEGLMGANWAELEKCA